MISSKRNNKGYTLVEILVALTMAVVVLTSIFYAFKSQQDSYVVQSQVTVMQQTLRGAMYMMTRDAQMAGYYTNFDPGDYTMNWDNLDGDNETIRPLLYARNNIAGVTGIRNGTDVIVIVKASLTEGKELGSAEYASGSTLTLTSRDLDGDGDNDLQANYCGVLVQSDLSGSKFFQLDGTANLVGSLSGEYSEGDLIFRADVIRYYVDDDATRPGLRRHNMGNNESGGQLVAENIENLQVRYQLDDGTWVDDPDNPPTHTAANVRAVEIFLVARTDHTIRGWNDTDNYPMWAGTTYTPATADSGFRRQTLSSGTEIRNIGS